MKNLRKVNESMSSNTERAKARDSYVLNNALSLIEKFFNDVVTEANSPYYNEVCRVRNKKNFLTDPSYMQNLIVYTATMLVDSILDDLDIRLLLQCKVTSVDIDCTTEADTDFLVVTFEYPNNNEIENYRIAIPCKVKDDYISFSSFKEE